MFVCTPALSGLEYTEKNLFEILLNQPEIRSYLPFSDWFGTKRTSVWFQNNREIVNTIWFLFNLIKFGKYFSVCDLESLVCGQFQMVYELGVLCILNLFAAYFSFITSEQSERSFFLIWIHVVDVSGGSGQARITQSKCVWSHRITQARITQQGI